MEKLFKNLRSWKTTAAGMVGGLIICLTQIANVLDDNPETKFVEAIFLTGITAMGLGFAAKDGDKSTEDVS